MSSPLLHAGGDQHVSPTALAVEDSGADGVGDPLGALALERVAGACARRGSAAPGTAASRRSRRRRGTRRPAAGRPRAGWRLIPAPPSCSSADTTRAGSFSPVATMTSAPWASSASAAARGAARETTTVSGTSRVAHELGIERQPRPESKTTRRGWRVTPAIRAVSSGSSASAVPTPTATASHSARQRCARRRLDSSPEIHLSRRGGWRPCRRGVIADLNSTHGRPTARGCSTSRFASARAPAGRGSSSSRR